MQRDYTCEFLGECLDDLVDLLIRLCCESYEYGLPTVNKYRITSKKQEKRGSLFVNDRSHTNNLCAGS